MNHDREHAHASTSPTADLDANVAPGRASRTDGLLGPTGPRASGLLMRKAARDDNNVAADADAAVGAASSSTGSALPDDLRSRFEGSLGTDLSSVRVHTGASSVDAASAVGAKAYTLGNDIHFGAGQFDPSSPGGQHLLAHEVAHTVQQRGGSPTRQNKLEVSSPGDHHEHEADRAADAMVSGGPATVGSASGLGRVVQREASKPGIKDNSYNRGELKWEGGTALGEEETKAWAGRWSTLLGQAGTLLGVSSKLGSLSQSTVVAKLKEQDQFKQQLAEGNVKFYEWQVEDGASSKQTDNKAQLAACKAELKKLKDSQDTRLTQVTQNAVSMVQIYSGYAGQFASFAGTLLSETTSLNTSGFKDLGDMNAKLGAALSVCSTLMSVCDRTAIDNFQNNPNFQTAAAWGQRVGNIFDSLSGFAGAVPGPWGKVLSQMMTMPKVVISQFTQVVSNHYAMYDHMVADTTFGNGKMIPPGQSGGTPPPPE